MKVESFLPFFTTTASFQPSLRATKEPRVYMEDLEILSFKFLRVSLKINFTTPLTLTLSRKGRGEWGNLLVFSPSPSRGEGGVRVKVIFLVL